MSLLRNGGGRSSVPEATKLLPWLASQFWTAQPRAWLRVAVLEWEEVSGGRWQRSGDPDHARNAGALLQFDTGYVRTYTVFMNITLSIDEQIIARAREKLRATGKSVNQEIREHLQHVAGDDDLEIERDLELFERLSGLGNSNGWKFNRDELYEERLRWPRS
jgi:hypothetical protein